MEESGVKFVTDLVSFFFYSALGKSLEMQIRILNDVNITS